MAKRRNTQLGAGGLSADTEALTKGGWRSGTELTRGEAVATFDCTRNTYKFDRVSSVSLRRYEGPMVHLESRGLDCLLTPGHPLLLRTWSGDGTKHPWRYQEAGEPPRNFKMPIVGPLRAAGLAGISNDLLQVIGWVVASGSYHSRGANPVLCLQRSAEIEKLGRRLVDKIDRCLLSFKGVGRYERTSRPTINYYLGRGLSTQVLAYLKDDLHRIPRPLLEDGSPRQLSLLFEALMDMNGSAHRGRWTIFYAGSREGYADDFQELATRLGISTTKTLVKAVKGWVITLARRTERTIRQSRTALRQARYRGKVWDVWVPSGAILVRRNGRVCVVGGCDGHLETLRVLRERRWA